MMRQTRREFLRTTLAGAGLCAVDAAWLDAADTPRGQAVKTASDTIAVGKTGVKVSFLAQGTGYNGWARSSDHTRMGQEAFSRLLRHSLDQGVRFIDMADLYGSHPFVQKTVKDLPRDRYTLLSKIWPTKADWVTPSGGAIEEVNRFRKELGVDTIDICLLHCMQNDKWASEFERMRDDLSQLKQQGSVRAVGVSCHHHGALQVAATHPWVDVIFARINNKGGPDFAMDDTAEEVSKTLKRARANGKFVVGMKLFAAGKLVQPDQKDASLRYVFSHQLVDAVTIGMKSIEEVDDSIRRINQALSQGSAG